MDAQDVIDLETAKQYLVVDFPDQDDNIRRLISTAVAMVEQYTGYRLYYREKVFAAGCYETEIVDYPVTVTGVTLGGGVVNYTTEQAALSLYIRAPRGSVITTTVGYDNYVNIPGPLIDGALKILTYLYERRDIHTMNLPVDVQGVLNQFRRSPTI
jgi:ATP-dependent RNA circularization protein (DNA/RNA ligase family)